MDIPEYERTEYQQPIMVLPGTHESTVVAAALASVAAFSHVNSPNWEPWLAGAFAKTVRRAKNPTQFSRLAGLPGSGPIQKVGDALAVGFVPTTLDDMDPALHRLQVSGTDRGHTGNWPPSQDRDYIQVAINADLGMTTGKTAAQVAHALMAYAIENQIEWLMMNKWISFREVGTDEFSHLARTAKVVITDAGRTEIESGSTTVLVAIREVA